MKDMDVIEFARRISTLSTETPLSISFDEKYGQKEKRWWTSQREHLVVWCLYYPTEGVKGFEHKPSTSAKTMYNNYGRPETLLWLAEALNINVKGLIEEIKDEPSRTACKIIRKVVPFDRIIESLELI